MYVCFYLLCLNVVTLCVVKTYIFNPIKYFLIMSLTFVSFVSFVSSLNKAYFNLLFLPYVFSLVIFIILVQVLWIVAVCLDLFFTSVFNFLFRFCFLFPQCDVNSATEFLVSFQSFI